MSIEIELVSQKKSKTFSKLAFKIMKQRGKRLIKEMWILPLCTVTVTCKFVTNLRAVEALVF